MSDELWPKIYAGIVAAITAAMTWVVRTIFTNQKQIGLLEREITHNREIQEKNISLIQQQVTAQNEIVSLVKDWVNDSKKPPSQ